METSIGKMRILDLINHEKLGPKGVTHEEMAQILAGFATIIKESQSQVLDETRLVKKSIEQIKEDVTELAKEMELKHKEMKDHHKEMMDEMMDEMMEEMSDMGDDSEMDGMEDEVEDIKKDVDSLKGEELYNKTKLGEVLDKLDKMENEFSKIKISLANRSGKSGARKVAIIKRHNLSSQCDGSNKTFTLPRDIIDVVGVFGTQFPVQFNPLVDWTFNGQTIVLADSVPAPEAGQTLWALIEVLFY